jgi:hypothetical protein
MQGALLQVHAQRVLSALTFGHVDAPAQADADGARRLLRKRALVTFRRHMGGRARGAALCSGRLIAHASRAAACACSASARPMRSWIAARRAWGARTRVRLSNNCVRKL